MNPGIARHRPDAVFFWPDDGAGFAKLFLEGQRVGQIFAAEGVESEDGMGHGFWLCARVGAQLARGEAQRKADLAKGTTIAREPLFYANA